MLSLNELSDPNFLALFNARHPNTFNYFLTIAPPAKILQLGESMALDWRIAKHYFDELENKSEAYVQRRANFYKVAIVNNDSIKTNVHFSEQKYSHATEKDIPFTQKQRGTFLFHQTFRRIVQKLLHKHPLEYTQHFTVDIQNLYYFNDDCTGVRSGI